MKWIEIIRVGLGNHELAELLPSIARFISLKLPESGLESSHILTRGDYAGEVMVVLVWGLDKESRKKSDLAFMLQRELRHFGMANYSSWKSQVGFEHIQNNAGKYVNKITEKQ